MRDLNKMNEWCNDCKQESVFNINKHQDAVYINGERQRIL